MPTLNTPLPTTTYLNNKYTLNITITNNGTADATEFSVKLFDNNTQIANKNNKRTTTGTHTTITFTWTPQQQEHTT
ncbi:MAG: CARDB domain-containing protein [Methanobacterium sp.]